MANKYFLYDTTYGNTIVDKSGSSFSPTPPYGEIYYTDNIPEIQPLYLYRVTGGTINSNTQTNIDNYLNTIVPAPTSESNVTYGQFSGLTEQVNTLSGYTTTTGLQEITTIGAVTNIETTFSGGVKLHKIRPTGNTTTAIQINKADGITPVINIDTVSGLTGFGTISAKGLIHAYGTDNNDSNIQSNTILIDGSLNVDKNIGWASNGVQKWYAQTYRNENSRYWYLYNVEDDNNVIVTSESGRMGINNKTNIMNYHAILINGGPNDINIGGLYTQNYNSVFQIKITDVTGVTDMFQWRISEDDGESFDVWSQNTGCSTNEILIRYGVTVQFDSASGHTLGTIFEFGAFSQLPIGTFVVSPVGFTEVQRTDDYNGSPILYDDITAQANSSTLGDNTKIFDTGTTTNSLYFGTEIKIDAIYFNLFTFGVGVQMIAEYWDGTNWIVFDEATDFVDDTNSLASSGQIKWNSDSTINWIKAYMVDLEQPNYELYWIRLRTATSPTTSPVANSFARGGNYRIAVLTSPSDIKPSFYVDTLGRTNIGGGNIVGSNLLQINSSLGLKYPVGGTDSLVEFDNEKSCIDTLKLKLASNDTCGLGVSITKTRGTLDSPSGLTNGDFIGRIDFRNPVGSTGGVSSRISSQFMGNSTTRNADILFYTAYNNVLSEKIRIKSSGTTGFGVSNANAVVHLKNGTITIAPLKFTSGSLLTSPQAGAVEFLGNNWYGTTTGSSRNTFAFLEAPQFTGNVNLPSTTCLNDASLCTYILNSGGTGYINNYVTKSLYQTYTGTTVPNTYETKSNFNLYTGTTAPILNTTVTGATNGLTKSGRNICLGGNLTHNVVITGNTHNYTVSSNILNLCALNGINICDYNSAGINFDSVGGNVTLRGNDINNVEKIKIVLSNSQATFIDDRATPTGFQYANDYSINYVNRSLVDKAYVDSVATGLKVISSTEVSTIGNITLSGLQTIDGVSVTNGMRVLVKNQNTGSQNGIYSASTSTWTRTSDFDFSIIGEIANGDLIPVISGTTNGNTIWVLTTPDPVVSGETLTFSLFSKTSGVIGGNGICVTQTSGNYNVSVKLPSNCSALCSDNTGLYLNCSIAGTGLAYNNTNGILSVNGNALAGNSISWTGNTFNVNPATGTLATVLSTKLNVSSFNIYSGATTTAIGDKLATTIYQTYTGTTAPNTYLSKGAFNTYSGETQTEIGNKLTTTIYQTYTGTTVPNIYYTKSAFNSYSAATQTTLNKKAYLSGATFTGIVRAPQAIQNDNSTCVATTAWYICQAANACPLMDALACIGTSNLFAREDHIHPSDTSKLSVSAFNIYSGTTVPAAYASKSNFNTYTGITAPATYQTIAKINTYTGTTAPATFANKSNFVLFTGTTAPNTYKTITSIGIYTGTTAPATYQTIAKINTYTGTTAPATYLGKSAFGIYSGTTVPATYVTKITFNTYTGTTDPATYATKVNFNAYTGTTAPATYLGKSAFNTYSGTTVPATYATKFNLNYFTGTTAPATYATKTNFNTYSGTTVPNTYLTKTAFNTYSGATSTAIGLKLTTTIYQTYTGTTVPTTYLGKSAFNTYSGTTVPNTYLTKGAFNSYSGATASAIGLKLATTIYQTYTGTTAPAAYASKSNFNTYTGTTVPATYLGKSAFNTYTGTTVPATYLGKSAFNTYSGTTVPNTYLTKSAFNSYSGATSSAIGLKLATTIYQTYTGTTAPAAYASKFNFNIYTGTTAPAAYASKSNFNTYTGTTAPAAYASKTTAITGATNLGGGNAIYTSISANKVQLKTISGGTGISITNSGTQINVCSTITQFKWTGTTANGVGTYVNSSCVCSNPNMTFNGSALSVTGNINASTYVCSPIITGSTRICSPIVCGTSCVQSALLCSTGNVKGTILTGSTCVYSPTICATTSAFVPKAAQNNNSTCIASTSWYFGQSGSTTPLMNGTAAIGSSGLWSHQDHVHPSDTSRLTATIYQTYTGTTAPATFASKSIFNTYTGTTAPNRYFSKTGGTITGSVRVNSNVIITGTTKLSGTTYLKTLAAANITTDSTLFWNPTTCDVRKVKLTGGSDVYFYTDNTTLSTSSSSGICVYLSGTPWNFSAGRYQIDFSAQYGNSTNNGCTCLIFALDGSTIGSNYIEGGMSTPWTSSASLSRDVTLGAGCHCLTISYCRTANTGCITYGMIRAKRIC